MGRRVIVTDKGKDVQVIKRRTPEKPKVEEPPVKKKLGRPRKVVDTSDIQEPPVKKKRGRPRKIVETPTVDMTEKNVKSTPELDALFKTPEPTKEAIPVVVAEVVEDEEKKGPGRPKKPEVNTEDLPHLHGYKWYQWAWDFFTSTDRNCFLNAANQASKSSTQIRKMIHWATDKDLWPKLWTSTPRQFWYLYPSLTVASTEVEEKWIPEFLPRGEYIDHPIYGWKAIYKFGSIHRIKFNSGVSIYFKSYEQKKTNTQSSSVHYVACDEELPADYWAEISARRTGVDVNGYFSMVFTATVGQIFWYETMECVGQPEERFKGAWKRQVSLYECLKYKDGTRSNWTKERIQEIKDDCESENEILRRVFGRFIPDKTNLFGSFKGADNQIPNFPVPGNWDYHLGVFFGKLNASIVLIASSPSRDKFLVKDSVRVSPRLEIIRQELKNIVRDLPVTSKYTNLKPFSEVLSIHSEFFQVVPTPTEGFHHLFNDLFLNKKLFLTNDNNALALCFRTMKTEDISKWIGYEKIGASFLIISQIYFPVEASSEKKDKHRVKRRWEHDYHPPERVDDYEAEFEELNSLCGGYYD